MLNMDDLRVARKKAEVNIEKTSDNFEAILQEAMDLFFKYAVDFNDRTLKESASKFFKALSIKHSHIEPYIYLSYIFYFFDQEKVALEYLQRAQEIDPAFPEVINLQKILHYRVFH